METAVFFGANSDICKATVELLNNDRKIVLVTRDKSKLPEHLQQQYECHSCDPCQHEDVNRCVESLSEKHSIDTVINFCGSIMLKSASNLTFNDWQQTININLTTAFNIAHATTKLVKNNCSLIFFSTAAAHLGLPNHEAIAAAKAGVEGLSKSIAASYAKKNIRSNVIAPGLVRSNLSNPITKSTRGAELSLSLHALNRLGEPSDIARMVVWLCQPENDWITGEVFRIDGGLSTTKLYS